MLAIVINTFIISSLVKFFALSQSCKLYTTEFNIAF
jgi:hypothetical protein